jgi:hypothetical protein
MMMVMMLACPLHSPPGLLHTFVVPTLLCPAFRDGQQCRRDGECQPRPCNSCGNQDQCNKQDGCCW